MTDLLPPGLCPPGGCLALDRARVEQAAAVAFEAGRAYERDAATELKRLELTWEPVRRSWTEQVAERVARLGPSRPLRYDDPEWPAVAVPGAPGVRLGGPENRGRPW